MEIAAVFSSKQRQYQIEDRSLPTSIIKVKYIGHQEVKSIVQINSFQNNCLFYVSMPSDIQTIIFNCWCRPQPDLQATELPSSTVEAVKKKHCIVWWTGGNIFNCWCRPQPDIQATELHSSTVEAIKKKHCIVWWTGGKKIKSIVYSMFMCSLIFRQLISTAVAESAAWSSGNRAKVNNSSWSFMGSPR